MADAQKTILIVDDDPDIINSVTLVLNANGFQVECASNTEQAMAALENRIPDMMILDVMMSTVDEGFQLSYRIRGEERLSQIPILMMTGVARETGFSFDPDKDGAWLPVNEYVEKPVDPPELLRRVKRLLNLE